MLAIQDIFDITKFRRRLRLWRYWEKCKPECNRNNWGQSGNRGNGVRVTCECIETEVLDW